jgi:hypothetical protein
MKSTDNVGITFVNAVTGRGILNNVVNVQLGALTFDATEEGQISDQLVVACRLRMDRACAQQLHDTLGDLLAAIEKAESEPTLPFPNGETSVAEGKPN